MDFSPEELQTLVRLVKDYPSLYDVLDKNYRDHPLRESAWVAIGQNLNKNPDSCKKCWRNIKDSYTRFMRRYKETGQIDKRSNWALYKKMTFLEGVELPNYKSKKLNTNKTIVAKPVDNPVVLGIEHVVFNKPTYYRAMFDQAAKLSDKNDPRIAETGSAINLFKTQEDKVTSAEADKLETVVVTEDDSDDEDEGRTAKSIKRRRLSEEKKGVKILNTMLQNNSQNNQEDGNEEDTALSFFVTHLMEVLKRLPPKLQIQAKQDLFQVLTNYEMLALGEGSSTMQKDSPKQKIVETKKKRTPPIVDLVPEIKIEHFSEESDTIDECILST